MLKMVKQALWASALTVVALSAHAQGLDLAGKTDTFVETLDTLGLPVLILAILVGVFGYWFRAIGLAFAASIVIGGVIFGAAPEIADFLLA